MHESQIRSLMHARRALNAATDSERETLFRAIDKEHPDFSLIGPAFYERYGYGSHTALFLHNDAEFVFVPGDTVNLGWNGSTEGLDAFTEQGLRDMAAEMDYPGTLEEYLRFCTSPPRQVTVGPMLVERTPKPLGWYKVCSEDPYVTANEAYRECLRTLQDDSECRCCTINEAVRISRTEQGLLTELYKPMSYAELVERTASKHFSIPTEDEWEYLCGMGSETLWRWGGAIDPAMRFKWFSPDEAGPPYGPELPNGFGLTIAYDPYKPEPVDHDVYFLKGGDSGCAICGGFGVVGGHFPLSTFFRDPLLVEDEYAYRDHLDGNYVHCRRIRRL